MLVNTIYKTGGSGKSMGTGSLIEINGSQIEPNVGTIEETEITTKEVNS